MPAKEAKKSAKTVLVKLARREKVMVSKDLADKLAAVEKNVRQQRRLTEKELTRRASV